MLIEVANFFGLMVGMFVFSSEPEPPSNPHVEYIRGDTNLIFSVPHDGKTNLTSIPVRRNGCKDTQGVCVYPGKDDCAPDDVCKVVTWADFNALVIARTVFANYVTNTGRTPHMIISHLHRSMLDPNRPVEQAAQGQEEAIAAYEAFHGSIKHAHAVLDNKPGLHIDFHGYTDKYRQNNTMIGYLFNKQDLISGQVDTEISSIKALVRRTGIPVEEFLHGENSLGSMFETAGYKAVPSPRQPSPALENEKYYRGGWITQIHGSRDGGNIDAIQLEFPTEIRIEATEEDRERFGVRLAENIEKFQSLYYQ